jgi:hypothetical protein
MDQHYVSFIVETTIPIPEFVSAIKPVSIGNSIGLSPRAVAMRIAGVAINTAMMM